MDYKLSHALSKPLGQKQRAFQLYEIHHHILYVWSTNTINIKSGNQLSTEDYVIPNNLIVYILDWRAIAPKKPNNKIRGTVTINNANTTKKLV